MGFRGPGKGPHHEVHPEERRPQEVEQELQKGAGSDIVWGPEQRASAKAQAVTHFRARAQGKCQGSEHRIRVTAT